MFSLVIYFATFKILSTMVFSKYYFVAIFLILYPVFDGVFSRTTRAQSLCHMSLKKEFPQVPETAHYYAKYAFLYIRDVNLEEAQSKAYYELFRDFLKEGTVRAPEWYCEKKVIIEKPEDLQIMDQCKKQLTHHFGYTSLEAVMKAFFEKLLYEFREFTFGYNYMFHISEEFTLDGSMNDPIHYCLESLSSNIFTPIAELPPENN